MATAVKRFWTTRELRDAGKTHSDIAAAVRTGKIHRITRGLYCKETPDDLVRLQGLAWLHQGLVYTGDTAAHLHGIAPMTWPAQGRVPHSTSRDGGEPLSLTGAETRRTRRLQGVTTLTALETAISAESLGPPGSDDRRTFLQRSYAGAKGNDRLAEDLAGLPPLSRKKAGELTKALITGTASDLELAAVRLIVAVLAGLEVTVLINAVIRGYRFDVVIPEARVCIEIDSRRYHSARSARRENFIKDRWKGNAAVRFGWTLLRYPDASINDAPDAVAEEVRDTVEYNLAYPRTRRQRTHEIPTDRQVWLWHRW